ncbi:hypothetical protein G7054_g926 [Neopestalotiopsis clavispora]|nr:hypothetical protein G7054_g926 [Neopestalotiopsis clavispora]
MSSHESPSVLSRSPGRSGLHRKGYLVLQDDAPPAFSPRGQGTLAHLIRNRSHSSLQGYGTTWRNTGGFDAADLEAHHHPGGSGGVHHEASHHYHARACGRLLWRGVVRSGSRLRGGRDESVDVDTMVGGGTAPPTVTADTVAGSVYRDQGYETVDDEAGGDGGARHRGGHARSRYAESVYTVREEDDEYDEDWERRTMVTEVAPSSRRSGGGVEEKRRREEKIWSKGDWKGLEVFG